VLRTACDRLFTQIADLLAELAARHGISSIQQVGSRRAGGHHRRRPYVLRSRRVRSRGRGLAPFPGECHVSRRAGFPSTRGAHTCAGGVSPRRNRNPARRRSSPIDARLVSGCLARQRLAKVDSDLYSETSVHETPVLLSILEHVVDQLETDEAPEPSTLSLTAKSTDHRTRSWWSTPADDRLPCLARAQSICACRATTGSATKRQTCRSALGSTGACRRSVVAFGAPARHPVSRWGRPQSAGGRGCGRRGSRSRV